MRWTRVQEFKQPVLGSAFLSNLPKRSKFKPYVDAFIYFTTNKFTQIKLLLVVNPQPPSKFKTKLLLEE